MGRWTERLAARAAPEVCANSANSANSPTSEAYGAPNGTNGTNGTATPSPCDRVAFDETAGALEYDHRQPRSVAEAVASLTHMKPPESMTGERWAQLVEDAGRFAATRWREAEAKGWTVLEVFGCSPGFARRLDRDGLVTLLYGRSVGAITSEYIEIHTGGCDVLRFPKGKGAGATTVWNASGGTDGTR